MKISSGKISHDKYIIRYAGGSHRGKRRKLNEDSFALLPETGLFCVADGVGGLDAGDVASKRAIDYIVNESVTKKDTKKSIFGKISEKLFSREDVTSLDLIQVICDANKDVYDLTISQNKKMATTMVALQLKQQKVIIGSVGDSRAYLLRNNILGQVTIDHTLAMQLKIAGIPTDSGSLSINEHTITRAIGSQPEVDVDEESVTFNPGDIFLLCSDGLTDMLSDKVISKVANQFRDDTTAIIKKLILGANLSGGRDNITLIALIFDEK